VAEVYAVSGSSALEALARGFRVSDPCFTVTLLREPVAMFGVAPIEGLPEFGAPWMLAAEALFEHKVQFLRESRGWIEKMRGNFSCLTNCVDARNQTHIRWLEWAGFKFIARHEEHGFEKRPFLQFVMWKDENHV
jgi:hypothetical protein